MNHLPTCIFEVNEMGSKEFTWSVLTYVTEATFMPYWYVHSLIVSMMASIK